MVLVLRQVFDRELRPNRLRTAGLNVEVDGLPLETFMEWGSLSDPALPERKLEKSVP